MIKAEIEQFKSEFWRRSYKRRRLEEKYIVWREIIRYLNDLLKKTPEASKTQRSYFDSFRGNDNNGHFGNPRSSYGRPQVVNIKAHPTVEAQNHTYGMDPMKTNLVPKCEIMKFFVHRVLVKLPDAPDGRCKLRWLSDRSEAKHFCTQGTRIFI